MSKVLDNKSTLLKENHTTYKDNFQSSSQTILSYWNKVNQQDLQQHPSKKREYQLQQYLLQNNQENEIP
jgi:hypothetical protein